MLQLKSFIGMISINRTALLFLVSFSIVSSEPGDLVSFNYQDNIGLATIEAGLLFVGGGLGFPTPAYTISTYDIKYQSQNSNGTLDTLSGLVSIPNSTTLAFPILKLSPIASSPSKHFIIQSTKSSTKHHALI